MKFESKAVHAGVHPDPSTGAIMTPIFQTSTYVQDAPGEHKGFEYARTHNPTRRALEDSITSLENGFGTICFASGLAAQDAILKLLKPGDEIVSTNDLYGGSYRQMVQIFQKYGIKSTYVDFRDLSKIEEAITNNTRLLWMETPTNPLLNIIDLAGVSAIAKKHRILSCVDNTFATPYLQRPIDLGVDLVLHSGTKYLGGHSDVISGSVTSNSEDLYQQLKFLQNATGAVPGPMDCFLMLRGIKTLAVRMDRACSNAEKIAHHLKGHPKIDQIFYPGLEQHTGHQIAQKQMKHFGAMVSFALQEDHTEAAFDILRRVRIFSLAESLGGVESLIGHPASMTHASIPREERLKVGLKDSLIRLSVGIEHVDDLIADLDQAIG